MRLRSGRGMSESGIEEMLPKVDSTSKKKSVVTSLVTTLTAEREALSLELS